MNSSANIPSTSGAELSRLRRSVLRPFLAGLCAFSFCFLSPTTAKPPEARTEVQSHGVYFEKWVRDTFFEGYQPLGYTQKWDIPAEVNKSHGGLPINPKAIKWGTPIDLGDALRQWKIAEQGESFILLVGFWEQVSPTEKRFVRVEVVTVTPKKWQALWAPITKADLEKLDAVIKDTTKTVEETRVYAQQLKSKAPFTQATLQVNPKINKDQRRLQCSLRFKDFFQHFLNESKPEKSESPMLWGKPVPPLIGSKPRTFESK